MDRNKLVQTIKNFFQKGCLLGNLFEVNVVYTVLIRDSKRQTDGKNSFVSVLTKRRTIGGRMMRKCKQSDVGR